MVFIIVYYSWSKSTDSTKVRNESRCFMTRSCLLAGQCPAFVAFLFIACLFGSSRGQWYRRWSIVWSPCSLAHVAFSGILNRWKYDIVNCLDEVLLAMYDWNGRIWSDADGRNQRNCRKSCATHGHLVHQKFRVDWCETECVPMH